MKTSARPQTIAWSILLSISIPFCAAAEDLVFPGDSWSIRSPAKLGLDSEKLNEFAERVRGDGCIVKDGHVVFHWGNWTAQKDWASAAKPVLSTLLLFAVHEGKLTSVDAEVKSVGWPLSEKDASMTFRHLANMTSGYSRGEKPGSAWAYNDFAIELYARSLERTLGEQLDAAIRKRMEALDFEDGAIFGSRRGAGVIASPRDFARIGWFWLNRGKWHGRQILPERYFDEWVIPGVPATVPRTTSKGEDYLKIGSYGGSTDQTPYGPGVYGFNLWFNESVTGSNARVWPALPPDTYQANGMWNRDTVTIIPSLKMVVAVRGAKPGKFDPGKVDSEFNQNFKLIVDSFEKRL